MKLPKSLHKLGYLNRELQYFMSDEELKEFNKWIGGQTGFVTDNGEFGFYSWDVKRFLEMVRKLKPTYWD